MTGCGLASGTQLDTLAIGRLVSDLAIVRPWSNVVFARLATHWLADEGVTVPDTYGDVFSTLAQRGTIETGLGDRLRAAVGLRNLVAHQYGVLDFTRVHGFAQAELDDLLAFCDQLAAHTRS